MIPDAGRERDVRDRLMQSQACYRLGDRVMTNVDSEGLSRTVFRAAEPQLFVANLEASFAFYTRRLGFAVAFSYGEPPFYGQVFRGGARLNLRCVESGVVNQEVRARDTLLAASITVDDAAPLFLEYQAADVDFVQMLREEPWGARTFIVRDPDGNFILFAGQGD